jgi:hypothetical protein
MPNGDVSFDANETSEARHMEDDIWADRAFYDDGEWVHWSEIEEQVRFKEWGAKYPNARKSLIPYFEELLSLAEGYHLETGLHLNVYAAYQKPHQASDLFWRSPLAARTKRARAFTYKTSRKDMRPQGASSDQHENSKKADARPRLCQLLQLPVWGLPQQVALPCGSLNPQGYLAQ